MGLTEKFEVTEEHLEWVRQMTKDGATKKYMCASLGIDFKTFQKYFADFVDGVKKEGRKKIAKAVADLAEEGDTRAAIYLLQQSHKEDFSFFEIEEVSDDPIDFLTKVFKREDVPLDMRMRAATSLLPYKSAKLASAGVKDNRKGRAKEGAAGGGRFGDLDSQLGEGRA